MKKSAIDSELLPLSGDLANFVDTLTGNAGNDTLLGNGGADTIVGGAGKDTMTGGLLNDRFTFTATTDSPTLALADVITDFDKAGMGNDTINLTALFGPTMAYRGALAFTGAGQVRAFQSGADVIVEVNTVGASGAEAVIRLASTAIGIIAIDDFVL